MSVEINEVKTSTTELAGKCDVCGDVIHAGELSYLCSLNAEDGTIFSGQACWCCAEDGEEENPEDYMPDMSDVEADADTLASAGMGTDEDYGYFGGDEY